MDWIVRKFDEVLEGVLGGMLFGMWISSNLQMHQLGIQYRQHRQQNNWIRSFLLRMRIAIHGLYFDVLLLLLQRIQQRRLEGSRPGLGIPSASESLENVLRPGYKPLSPQTSVSTSQGCPDSISKERAEDPVQDVYSESDALLLEVASGEISQELIEFFAYDPVSETHPTYKKLNHSGAVRGTAKSSMTH